MKRPHIGELRQKVVLQKPIDTTDAGGGVSVVWQDVETIRAKVVPLRGREMTYAMGLANPITHRFLIRYRSDVLGKWRVVYDGREFSIQAAVDPDERKRFLELSCEEGLPT
jgi:SPP1 family predicted phage head-tail adaptor